MSFNDVKFGWLIWRFSSWLQILSLIYHTLALNSICNILPIYIQSLLRVILHTCNDYICLFKKLLGHFFSILACALFPPIVRLLIALAASFFVWKSPCNTKIFMKSSQDTFICTPQKLWLFGKMKNQYSFKVVAVLSFLKLTGTKAQMGNGSMSNIKTRHVFVKHGCPRRQQSQNMAKISKSYILNPPTPRVMWCKWGVRNPYMNLQSKIGYCIITQTLNIALCL